MKARERKGWEGKNAEKGKMKREGKGGKECVRQKRRWCLRDDRMKYT